MAKKILVIDHETYQDPETGKTFTTHSRPDKPAPDGRYDSPEWAWHDVKCAWVPIAEIDKPCMFEMGD